MLVLPGFLVFAVVSLVVGTRLVLLWRSTRQLPELLIGIGVLGIGPLGFGASAAAGVLHGTAPAAAAMLVVWGAFAASAGIASKLVFNWRVYHPQDAWAARLAKAGIAVAAVALVATLLVAGEGGMEVPRWYLTRGVVQTLALLWGATEALLYWDKMRRRRRLGLAEALVTNRFLLWGIAAGSAGLGTGIGVIFQLVTGVPAMEVPALLLSSSIHGLVAAVAMWLAFVPPGFYRRWVGEAEPAAHPAG